MISELVFNFINYIVNQLERLFGVKTDYKDEDDSQTADTTLHVEIKDARISVEERDETKQLPLQIQPRHQTQQTGWCHEIYGNRQIFIFYGSQTGTAEMYSRCVCRFLKKWCFDCLIIDPASFNYDDFVLFAKNGNIVCIFILSTFGMGESTDNATPLKNYLSKKNNLNGLQYCVFAIGDRCYDDFCKFGRFVDQSMEENGALKIIPRVDADINGSIQQSFMQWRSILVSVICKNPSIPKMKFSFNELQEYRMVYVKEQDPSKIFVGEVYKLGTYFRQKKPFHQKNPFLAPILTNKEIFNSEERSCKLLEFDLSNSSIRYEPGDHVGVYPTNNPQLVSWLGQLLNVDLEQIITMEQVDTSNKVKKYPFPCPTSLRTAFMYYLDITSPVHGDLLRELITYTTSPDDVSFLEKLTDVSDDRLYQEWIVESRRDILCVLEDLPTTIPPVDILLDMLPRMNCRYYSVASSPKLHPKSVQIAAVIVDWIAPSGRKKQGVATTYLNKKKPKNSEMDSLPDRVPIFIRRASYFHMPTKNSTPLIMIGCGCGVAPFKGFMEHRVALAGEENNGKLGELLLFYGCRNLEKDCLFREEFEKFKDDGILTHLFIACSRDKDRKFYITEHIGLQENLIWLYLERGAYIYICGPAKINIDVQLSIHRVIHHVGKLDEERVVNYIKNMKSKGRYCVDVW